MARAVILAVLLRQLNNQTTRNKCSKTINQANIRSMQLCNSLTRVQMLSHLPAYAHRYETEQNFFWTVG